MSRRLSQSFGSMAGSLIVTNVEPGSYRPRRPRLIVRDSPAYSSLLISRVFQGNESEAAATFLAKKLSMKGHSVLFCVISII